MPEDSFCCPSTLSCKFLSTGEAFTEKKNCSVLKVGYKECFDFMDQCFEIDHSDFISERQAVRLTVYSDEGIQEKQDIKGFLKSKGVCWERMENCIWHRCTHGIYLVSTRILRGSFDCNSLPGEVCEAARWGVSISDPGAHLEVFRGEWTQIHNGSPWGLPCSAQFEPPIINITGGELGGGWNCVHVRSKKGKKKNVCQSMSDAL